MRGVLEKLGHDTHVEDDALEMIRAEVCRLGTGQSIRTTIMASEKAATTDYVLGCPKGVPSTRDYLNDTIRSADTVLCRVCSIVVYIIQFHIISLTLIHA